MRITPVRFAWLLMAALLLLACTRDRTTPEPASSTPEATEAAANSTTNAEPVVESTGKTPSPESTGAAANAAGTGTPAPEATSTQKTFDYAVKSGDTLATIADKFLTTVQTLRELNFLLDDNILAGQVLAVPYVEGMTAEGAPTPTPTPFVYVVQAGDSLSSIAIQFDIKPITIVEINNLADPNNLAVGTELLIPGYVAPAPTTSEGNAGASGASDTGTTAATGTTGGGEAVVHVVQPSETLGQIAAEYGVDPVALAQANGITNGNLIRAGQKLTIPGITKRQALEARGTRHVVETGESLSSIAEKYGVSVESIMATNGLDDPNKIVVGQELLIPPQQ